MSKVKVPLVTESVTRSPIELLWTAKNISSYYNDGFFILLFHNQYINVILIFNIYLRSYSKLKHTEHAIFWRLHQQRNKSSQSIPRQYERSPDAYLTLISVPRKPELGSQSTILIQSWRNLEISKPRETHRSPTKHFFRI